MQSARFCVCAFFGWVCEIWCTQDTLHIYKTYRKKSQISNRKRPFLVCRFGNISHVCNWINGQHGTHMGVLERVRKLFEIFVISLCHIVFFCTVVGLVVVVVLQPILRNQAPSYIHSISFNCHHMLSSLNSSSTKNVTKQRSVRRIHVESFFFRCIERLRVEDKCRVKESKN